MKFGRSLSMLLAAGTILATGSIVLAEPGRRLERLSQELDLTSDQEDRIRAIYEEAKTDTADEREELRAARQQLQELLASNASEAELRQQHGIIQDLREELGDRRFEGILDVREVLTPEQRDRFVELGAERRQQRRSRFGGPRF